MIWLPRSDTKSIGLRNNMHPQHPLSPPAARTAELAKPYDALLLASFGDPSTRLREIVPFAIVLPALCILMFKYALRLPIPLAPPLLGY